MAGNQVGTEKMECDNNEVVVVPAHEVQEIRKQVQMHYGSTSLSGAALTRLLSIEPIDGTNVACDFEGVVEVEYNLRDALRIWTCPRCGYDHEDDLKPDLDQERHDWDRDTL